jgi:hypothetical protein
MLDETDGDTWISRRDGAIQAPIRSLTRMTAGGIPYLAPHVQLYYKAKGLREKDEIDFKAVMESLWTGSGCDKRSRIPTVRSIRGFGCWGNDRRWPHHVECHRVASALRTNEMAP